MTRGRLASFCRGRHKLSPACDIAAAASKPDFLSPPTGSSPVRRYPPTFFSPFTSTPISPRDSRICRKWEEIIVIESQVHRPHCSPTSDLQHLQPRRHSQNGRRRTRLPPYGSALPQVRCDNGSVIALPIQAWMLRLRNNSMSPPSSLTNTPQSAATRSSAPCNTSRDSSPGTFTAPTAPYPPSRPLMRLRSSSAQRAS